MSIEIGVAAEVTGVSMMARAAASLTKRDFAFLGGTLGVPVGGVGVLRVARMLPQCTRGRGGPQGARLGQELLLGLFPLVNQPRN